MKIGVITDCFKRPLAESIKLAGELGFDGVQIYATTGEFSPEVLDAKRKAEIKELLKENNLVISALCGDMGGHGFQIEADNPERVQKTKDIIDLAEEFGVSVITTHIGVIPSDKTESRYKVMLDAMRECGKYAAEKGVTLAIETGPETAKTLLAFLEDIPAGVGVNLDPANFVMVTDQDPVEAVNMLGKYIVHTHVKDGVMLKKTDPEIIYEHFATGGIEALNVADFFLETPLGEGKVDFPKYLEALRAANFDGFLTVERETGEDVVADITLAKTTVQNLLK
ncbi:MAG: sugar phosphate isomerase/epimerase [Clostridia bacterium]|nr:sugar phosphate isomerase/epimerase [Clostridia bacterium]